MQATQVREDVGTEPQPIGCTESLEGWLSGYWQRRRPGYGADDEFEQHMRILFLRSGYARLCGWKLADLTAALEAVRGQPVPEPVLPKPQEERPARCPSEARSLEALRPVIPRRAPRAIGAAKKPAKVKYCTEPGCRRRLPDYRIRAGLCPHHQQMHRRSTWRGQKRKQRETPQVRAEALSYS